MIFCSQYKRVLGPVDLFRQEGDWLMQPFAVSHGQLCSDRQSIEHTAVVNDFFEGAPW